MPIQFVAKTVLLVGLVAVLAACGAPAPTAVEVQVSLQEFSITSSLTNFAVGTEYSFVITNNGTLDHEFLLEAAGAVDVPLTDSAGNPAEVEEDQLPPGTSVTFEWTFDTAGDFQIACHVTDTGDHYGLGMVVPITVQ